MSEFTYTCDLKHPEIGYNCRLPVCPLCMIIDLLDTSNIVLAEAKVTIDMQNTFIEEEFGPRIDWVRH